MSARQSGWKSFYGSKARGSKIALKRESEPSAELSGAESSRVARLLDHRCETPRCHATFFFIAVTRSTLISLPRARARERGPRLRLYIPTPFLLLTQQLQSVRSASTTSASDKTETERCARVFFCWRGATCAFRLPPESADAVEKSPLSRFLCSVIRAHTFCISVSGRQTTPHALTSLRRTPGINQNQNGTFTKRSLFPLLWFQGKYFFFFLEMKENKNMNYSAQR